MPYAQVGDIDRVYKNFKKMPDERTDLYFGMEVEVVFKNKHVNFNFDKELQIIQDAMGEHAAIKAECGADAEIITCPATLKYHKEVLWQNWSNINDAIEGISGNGIHIHFSRAGITDGALARLIYFYHAPESNSFLTKIAGRRVGPDGCYNHAVKKKFVPNQPDVTINDNFGHRGAIAMGRTGKTVEVRIFQSTVSLDHIFSCFDLVAASIAWSTQVIADEKEMIADNFIRWFVEFGKGADYPHLSATMQKHKFIHEVKASPAEVKAVAEQDSRKFEVVETPYGVVELIRDAVTGRIAGRRRASA